MKKILQTVIEGDYAKFRDLVLPSIQGMINDGIKLKEEGYVKQIRNRENLKEASDYKAFLKKKFAEYKIKSPFELSKEEQKKFWTEVKKEWASESKETLKESEENLSPKQKEYRDFFMKKLKEFNVDSPAELDEEGKKRFFNEIQKEWK